MLELDRSRPAHWIDGIFWSFLSNVSTIQKRTLLSIKYTSEKIQTELNNIVLSTIQQTNMSLLHVAKVKLNYTSAEQLRNFNEPAWMPLTRTYVSLERKELVSHLQPHTHS